MKVLFIGSYTRPDSFALGKGKGIYSFEILTDFDNKTIDLRHLQTTEIENPSYLISSKDNKRLFAASEIEAQKNNRLHAFQIAHDGKITETATTQTKGSGVCYLSFHNSLLLGANYFSGSAFAISNSADDELKMTAFTQFQDFSNINRERQEGPHAHCTLGLPGTDQIYVTDLGADAIYQLDLLPNSSWKASDVPRIQLSPGSGPRHVVIHPNLKWIYVLCELSNQLVPMRITFDRNHNRTLEQIHDPLNTVALDNEDYYPGPEIPQMAAHLAISRNGRFIYCSNRGSRNSIAVFSVNEDNGTIELVEQKSSGGMVPRGFVIDSSGRFLLAANQNSDNLVAFWIDPENGKLEYSGKELHCPEDFHCPTACEIVDL